MNELYVGNDRTGTHNNFVYVQDGELFYHDTLQKDAGIFNNLDFSGGIDTLFSFGASNSTMLPRWWSQNRDNELRKASIQVDMISSVINLLTMKLYNLPVKVVAKNATIEAHVRLARVYDAMVQVAWARYAELFINDMLVYDKGAFLLVESDVGFSVPLFDERTGEAHLPTGLKYVNSRSITLTKNEDFPYFWVKDDGKTIKLHHSRVIRFVQFPVQLNEVTKVGLSFTSRGFNVAQLLAFAMQHGLESLGALESDTIIYATGTSGNSLKKAFTDARIEGQNQSRFRSANDVLLAIRDSNGKVGSFNRNRLPDGFNYDGFASLAIKLMAVAAGVDEDDIAAATNAGTTKTATLISELKSRGKLIAWFTNQLITQLQTLFLPQDLMMQVGSEADNINESKAKALINVARVAKINTEIGVLNVRESRVNALKNGSISQEQFERLELADDRLPDGLHVRALFFTRNPTMQKLLTADQLDDLCEISNNDAVAMAQHIKMQICELEGMAVDTTSSAQHKNISQALAALNWLLGEYEALQAPEPELQLETEPESDDESAALPEEDEDKQGAIEEELAKSFRDTVKARELRSALRKQVRNVWDGTNSTLNKQLFMSTLERLALEDPLVNTKLRSANVEGFLEMLDDLPDGAKLKDITTPLKEFIGP